MKRSRLPPPTLDYFASRCLIERDSLLWKYVNEWEQAGLLTVTRNHADVMVAWVGLTDAGRAEVERQKQH